MARKVCAWVWLLSVSLSELNGLAAELSREDSPQLTLALVDSQGKSVSGATVGTEATEREGRLWWNLGGENTSVVSDDQGRVYLDGDELFRPNYPGDYKIPIYALDEEKELVGLAEISRADFGRQVRIQMVKPCRVRGQMDSSQLRQLGYEVKSKALWVSSNAPRCSEFFLYEYSQHRYDRDSFEFLVPPGSYKIRAGAASNISGVGTEEAERVIDIEPGRHELDLGVIDLVATKLAKLIGKPAPELEGVREWKNGGPVKLAQLRGRVVLLHFWIYFCDRVYPQMHKLIDLYEEVRRQQLAVEIIVVHDGRFDTIAEMEAAFDADPRLVKVREEEWGGKDLPFLIALDSKEPTRHLGGTTYLRGINWSNYDVNGYPTTMLIDRRGVLVREFDFYDTPSALRELQPYLAMGIGDTIEGLDEFGVELSPDHAQDKMMLLCFWDMNQRPSRNCIVELAKQARQLKEKGATIVAVQATKVDENTLNGWVEENNIPFPVGMIQGDAEKSRFAWGIKSLPWLILTDLNHIMRAEGFAMSELDVKIKENVPSADTIADSDKVAGLVKDPQGQVLSNVRVTEFQTDKEYVTDADGKFASAYGPSENTRYFFAVHKQRELVGVGRLAAGQRHVETNLVSAKMVSGTVVDPDGKPVAGAQVAPLPMTCFHVLTDAQGKFDVGWDPEWAGDLKEFFLFARHQKRNLAALVYITPEAKTVDVKLEPALTLTGTITDPNDKPISGATIGLTLHTAASAPGWGCGTPVEPACSDDNGRYEFKALPQKQEWIIRAGADGYWPNGISTGVINRVMAHIDGGQIILKKPVLSVSGIVVDNTGKPVAKIQVGLRGEGQPERTTATDARGKFTLEKICVGSIEIWAKLGNVLYGTVTARAGQEDVKLTVVPMREPKQ
jgi:thiol-disulfide isomerase/thioredoxin